MKGLLWVAAAILFVAGIQTSSAYELTGRIVSIADGDSVTVGQPLMVLSSADWSAALATATGRAARLDALARQAARREVARQHQEARAAADVHTLRLPQSGQLYLISNLDPRAIARRYLGWSLFHLASFFAALAALPWAWRLPH